MESGHELEMCRITIGDKVGSGVTAIVYRGLLDGTTEVAVKEIEWSKGSLVERQQLAFDREVAIMSKVNHPNLVNLFGVVSVSMPLRIVTEFCGGGCCFELLHNAEDVNLVWAQQHKMCLDVAYAIEYLHNFEPKIIHRDLKSLNLLLVAPVTDENTMPHVKVSDFGLSRMQETAGGEWGKMTIAAGTHHWMAPEVHTGSSYNELVDVYSFAMIMFEIICREIPFEEEEPVGVGPLIVAGQRPDMEAVPPDCPPTLRDLMIRSWAQDASARPPFSTIVSELAPLKAELWPSGW